MRISVQKSLSAVLLVTMASTPMLAGNGTGVLSTSKVVMVNGVEMKSSGAIFPGDKITTPSDTNANLTFEGASFSISPFSEIIAQRNSFALNSGDAKVATSSGTFALVRKFTIRPINPAATVHYEINYFEHSAYVFARDGALKVEGGCKTIDVPEGRIAKIVDPKDCEAGLYLVGEHPFLAAKAIGIGATAVGSATAAAILLNRDNMSSSGP
jgi:hypothetical protein